ncbi:hypothetical protein M3664_04625 [Paenibacillus lautus]|uniref:hypothetical protein n=1 Tax=Paenibacillus lautus TaxID=1401 RepID=UPI00204124B8|nr:hypothetical protein [Paenibacillus lautus]MCM3257066.1 hypothetical protein [Paenibacillus lautus]
MVKYTEQEKEALIDSMLSIIKEHLMKCDIKDINIDKSRNIAGFYRQDGSPIAQKETGEYTYRVNFKYRKEFR